MLHEYDTDMVTWTQYPFWCVLVYFGVPVLYPIRVRQDTGMGLNF